MLRNHLAAKSAARGKSVLSSPKNSLSSGSNRSAFSRPTDYRSFIEPLEARQLLSATVIEVTTTQDIVDPNDAFISLREAILAANASPEDNEILLAAGTYTLTRQGANEDTGLTGDLDIKANGSLKIVGAGRESTTIDASGLFNAGLGYGDRIFDAAFGATFDLSNVSLTGGSVAGNRADGWGGALRILSGTVSIVESSIHGNKAENAGGGIYQASGSSMSIAESTISNNSAEYGGGAYVIGDAVISHSFLTDNSASVHGGGIHNRGKLTVEASTISTNSAGQSGAGIYTVNADLTVIDSFILKNVASHAGSGGGGITKAHGTARIQNSTISGNSSGGFGGGIYDFSASGSLTIEGAVISNNSASRGGGVHNSSVALFSLSNSSIISNQASGNGGGLYNSGPHSTLSNVFVSGNVAGGNGGGIYNFAGLTIDGATIENNQGANGGGIFNVNASAVLKLSAGMVSNNSAGYGGGLSNVAGGKVSIVDSTLSANAANSGGGGAIFNSGGSELSLKGSTLSDNRATADGGAISNNTGSQVSLANTTVSGNASNASGGGIYSSGTGSVAVVHHSTITLNRADASDGQFGAGGGMYLSANTLNSLNNSIIGGNFRGAFGTSIASDIELDAAAQIDPTSSYNFVASPATDGGLVHGIQGNIVGDGNGGQLSISAVLNTQLADNGGPTRTHQLVDTSPAINAGDPLFDPNGASSSLYDQRGIGFDRVQDGRTDMGAYEGHANPIGPGGQIVVGTFADNLEVDGVWSLREAVIYANSRPGDFEIVLASGTYRLTIQGGNEDQAMTGDLDILDNGNLNIVGAESGLTVIDATGLGDPTLNYGDRLFEVHGPDLEISRVTLRGGGFVRDGGAILNSGGKLTISDSFLNNNSADVAGGAIYSDGDLEISRSSLSSNVAVRTGGAIYSRSGDLTIVDSVLAVNSSKRDGGGIYADQYNGGTIAINRSSFAGNLAAGQGAAIYNPGVTPLAIRDSSFSGNRAESYGGAIYRAGAGELTISQSTFLANKASNGGAIHARGTGNLTLERSSFSSNSAVFYGGAISAWNGSSSTITDSHFSENLATFGGGAIQTNGAGFFAFIGAVFSGNLTEIGNGGAIEHTGTGILSVSQSILTSNSAKNGGAISGSQVSLINATISANTAAYYGGGLHKPDGDWYLMGVTLNGNSAGNGGGLYSVGPGHLSVSNSTVFGNTARNGGGIYSSSPDQSTLTSTLLSGNVAIEDGGGIYHSGPFDLVNSTVSGNSARQNGGGIYSKANLTAKHVTIVDNAADKDGNRTGTGGGLHLSTGATVYLLNTIAAGNRRGLSPPTLEDDFTLAGGLLDPASSYNLIGDPSTAAGLINGVNGNIVGDGLGGVLDVSTVLDTTLADNGGPTRTHALLATGPAVNAGDPNFDANAAQFDQRAAGYARVTGGRVDIGSFEFGSEFENVVSGRQVFYNNSYYDGQDIALNPFDVFAIDPTKHALLPNGSLADSSNVTSYSRGINGIMVDLAGSHPNITVDDFIFRVGASNDPASWAAAPAPSAIQVLAGQGVGGGDRVVITWPDGAILNTYLQVIVAANEDTGLDEPDAFFFGNRVGDSFNTQPAGSFTTTAADELAARSASPKLNLAISNPYDFDKSGTITAADQLISRANAGVLRRIQIAPPVNASPLAVLAVGQSNAALSAVNESFSEANALAIGLAARVSSSITELPQVVANAGTSPQLTSSAVRPSAPALIAAVDKVFGAPSASGSSESAGTWDDLLDELIPAFG